MALTDEGTNTTMLVQPSGFGGGGFGNFGGDGWWIILLFILLGGWGNGFGGGFGGGDLYPWMNNSQNINDGFRDQMLGTQINGIQNGITSGFGDVQNAIKQMKEEMSKIDLMECGKLGTQQLAIGAAVKSTYKICIKKLSGE